MISLHKTSFLPRVLPDFQGLIDDLRCALEFISIHKLLFSRHVFPDFCACGTHGLPCGCSPRPRGTKAPKTTLCWFPALLLILLFEVLLFRFLMTQSPLTSFLSSFFSFFACGTIILCLTASFPRPRGTNPVRKKSMLAYFMTSPGSIHAITLPARTASTVSTASSRCSCVRSSSQQQPAATTSQRCCHSTKHQEAPPQAGSAGAQ